MFYEDYLYHYGTPRHSGRYPWGSGKRPYQSEEDSKVEKGITEKQRLVKEVLGKEISRDDARVKNRTILDDPFTIRKGETIQHITGVSIEKLKSGQFYVSATDLDNKVYETFLGLRLKSKGWNPQKLTLSIKEDLKAPSEKTQMEVFSDMLKNGKKQVITDISQWLLHKGKINNIEEGINKYQNKSLRDIYMDFNNSLEYATQSSRTFYQKLKDMGYNAVIDEHDKYGSWMQGEKPIILMDALSMVSDFKVEDLTSDKLIKALDDYMAINKQRR